ncbi:MAG: PEP-CTERM sorting domain-containing protein [Oscillatoriales cyanobacterium RU_3_3]|nr:PEP-CTERM sorting domain-containing protein [Oscillatoriales cyanobacterium RU_3_3]NJR24247.1 PEP-CTERM sorting domain-containing protein [Richelia sp. CSU_2_1]
MSASIFANKFSPFSLGLSLLSAIAFSMPQSVQAASLNFNPRSWANAPLESPIVPEETPVSNDDGIYLDRPIPTSELPESVATRVLENASTTSGLPVSNLQIASVRQVTWRDGCMGRGGPNRICTLALVDGWIVTVESGEQKWVYHTTGPGGAFLADDRNSPPVNNPPPVGDPPPVDPCPNGDPKCDRFLPDEPGLSQQNPIMPNVTLPGFWSFFDVPTDRFIDPPTAYGFRYEITSDSLFTQILDFPTGFNTPFTVLVKDVLLGEFTVGNSVNFSNYSTLLGNLLVGGSGVKEFSVTGLNVDPTNPAAFPLKVAFNTDKANLNMHALLNEVEAVPEPSVMLGLFASGSFLIGVVRKRKQRLSR